MQDLKVDHSEKEIKDALRYVLSEPGKTYTFTRNRMTPDGVLSRELVEAEADSLKDWQLDLLVGECLINANLLNIDLHNLDYKVLSKNVKQIIEFVEDNSTKKPD